MLFIVGNDAVNAGAVCFDTYSISEILQVPSRKTDRDLKKNLLGRDVYKRQAMDKVEFCKNHGIEIEKEDWPNEGLPGQIITDKGREFIGNRMRELAEKFGMEFESLPPFRPDEKGLVEKAFDLIQQKYKPLLRGKGVIEADAQERWAADYRKQQC